MVKHALSDKPTPINIFKPCTNATNNDDPTQLTKRIKGSIARFSAIMMRIHLPDDHPLLIALRNMTLRRGFLTINGKLNEAKRVQFVDTLDCCIRYLWEIGEVQILLQQKFATREEACGWFRRAKCDPSCILPHTFDHSDGDEATTGIVVKSPAAEDCLCGRAYNGNEEPEFGVEALEEAVQKTYAMHMYKYLKDELNMGRVMMQYKRGHMLSMVGALSVNAAGAIALDTVALQKLVKAFMEMVEEAKELAGKEEKVWTDYQGKPFGKHDTMLEKALYIAHCMLTFNWVCKSHHVFYEGYNTYHGIRQHVVRTAAGEAIHGCMKVTWEKTKPKGAYDAMVKAGKGALKEEQGDLKDQRHIEGAKDLHGERKKGQTQGGGKMKGKKGKKGKKK
ncbi:hypothetical protein TrCOL_g2594 [Triparma columacea]|uniref:Uncharacterized protein n=1 Tax=Triparma columacea TaxID=722753 RepID=A0A9W7L572_9STRA|nr:hypothetical protein TrCOL_g2594 [Triparma columacea]